MAPVVEQLSSSSANVARKPSSTPKGIDSKVMDTKHESKAGVTFQYQESLPKLPIAGLEDTCWRYLEAVKPLQTKREHADTVAAVQEFLSTDGPVLQDRLKKYANNKSSYIEQFCTFINGVWFVHLS
jgi:carnitine O-acetyltransferase